MPSYEIQFPNNISYGSQGGPSYSTTIVGTETGIEHRLSRWSTPRRKYNVAYGIKTYQDLQDVIEHYMAVKGSYYSFRYKDWLDYSTIATDGGGGGAYSNEGGISDEPLAKNYGADVVGGGAGGYGFQVQLKKRYCVTNTETYTEADGTVITPHRNTTGCFTRIITKPVLNTVKLGVMSSDNGTVYSIGSSNFEVDYRTGVCTLNGITVATGDTIFGGCQFDVPVRFEGVIDDLISITPDSFDTGSISSIELIEVVTGIATDQDVFYGGASFVDLESPNTLSVTQGRVGVVRNVFSNNDDLKLQDPQLLQSGGPYFYIFNEDDNLNFTLKDLGTHAGASDEIDYDVLPKVTVEMWVVERSDGEHE